MIRDLSEENLLYRLKSGDMKAFESLYELYSSVIYNNIFRLIKNRTVSEDLLQDVFIKIWENREKIDPKQSFVAYLFICSRNIAFNFKRRLKLEITSSLNSNYSLVLHTNAVDDWLEKKEVEQYIERIINELPEQRQRVFRLAKLDGKKYQEIADDLGISISTVKDHLVKANKFVKKYLIENGGLNALFLTFYFFLKK
ncbi:hypothetical protein CHU00_18350 [Sphingobacterium cellulitidis]|uniref:RNA polymerase sigma factor n=1 Tax=Sphingobacterium cellulitidis TaxID=1768011 RepID=UPI000B93AB22|nr:RNA polymerase sigma-70 factor [Sphingobacterium cellulitidis]OYD44149.1 hypothetical protein CHU00_18350 [Sphingobacterium cellulitidis]